MSDNDKSAVGPPVFVPQRHPELKQLGRKAIHNFLRDRERYLMRVKDAAEQGSTFEAVTLKASVDLDLLISLVDLDTFPQTEDVQDLTDEVLLRWLQEQDEVELETFSLEELEAMVRKSVQMKTSEPDAKLRVMSLFADYKTLLRQKKIESLIEDNPKVATAHICSLLRPPTLRKKIENDLALHKACLRKNWKAFYKYVMEKAVACDEFVPVNEKHDSQGSQKGASSSHGTGSSTFDRRKGFRRRDQSRSDTSQEGHADRKPKHSAEHGSAGGDKQKKPINDGIAGLDKNGGEKELPLCLNKETCPGERHIIWKCDKTPDEKKRQLVAEYKQKKSMKRVRFDRSEEHLQKSANGRLRATLMGAVNTWLLGDYGADHSALSEDHIQDLARRDIFVPILELEQPVTMQLAVDGADDKLTISTRRKARVTTSIDTPEGPLTMRNVEYLVFREPMTEILLSRPLLQSLGFDLDAHLLRVREQFHDKDFSNITFEVDPDISDSSNTPGKLARLLRQQNEPAAKPEYLDESSPEVPRQDDDPIPALAEQAADVGQHSDAEVRPYLDKLIDEAINNGLPVQLQHQLKQLVYEYADVFRVKLGSDPPADIPPMKIKLAADARPVRVKPRRYTQDQIEFLRKKVKELEGLGLIRRNAESSWACAPLIVPKPGPDRWRFTTDLRPVNKVTVPYAWPMPDIETVTSQLAGKDCFATIDLCQGYWQLPLHEDSQECQSFITPDGVYSPTRVMHGQRNAVAFCQSSVLKICESIIEHLLLWLDDMLLHAANAQELLEILQQLFALCRRFRLKLHAKKSHLFLRVVKWCGRVIDGKGVRMDPARLQALLDMPSPSTGEELQQFVCAANWMRTCIPEFTVTMSPLTELLEEVYQKVGKRTKRAVAKIQLEDIGWSAAHTEAFTKAKTSLANAASLAHPDATKLFCLFTDASDKHWSGVLTQIAPSELDQPFDKQSHEPLAFLSGSFTGSSRHWSTPEKEAAAIIFSVDRLDYLLLRPEGFHLFTDHSNLVFIYHPEKSTARISRNSLNKVRRWGTKLSHFQYTIVHISGEDNTWADLLSRWGTPELLSIDSIERANTHLRIAGLFRAPLAPDLDKDLTWPGEADIIAVQASVTQTDVKRLQLESPEGIWLRPTGAIWIPADATHLQLRICVIGHCGRGGHRSADSTLTAITEFYFWETMDTDIREFCKSCLHCIATIGGLRTPRPLGHALHSDKPNELIHFDFLLMGESKTLEEYVMIIKDDASTYTWLDPWPEPTAENAVSSLLKWFSAFGVVPTWVSDRGSHFKNQVMQALNRSLHSHHHFTAPNNPQANGTVERVCREVLRCCRALLSEFRMKETEWPSVLPIVQSVLNHSKRQSLGDRAPITLFTGLPADNPLRLIVPPKSAKVKSVDEAKVMKLLNTDALIEALEEMHKEVSQRRNTQRAKAIALHNEKTHVQAANYSVGDFVLVAKVNSKQGHKLKLKWHGPYRIVRVESDWVYECQDLINEKTYLVHANRLKFYSDSELHVTQELLDTIEHNQPHYQTVTKILDIRHNKTTKAYEVQCKWRGFAHEEPTWEPVSIMHEDIPDMLEKFFQSCAKKSLVKQARNSLRRHGERGV